MCVCVRVCIAWCNSAELIVKCRCDLIRLRRQADKQLAATLPEPLRKIAQWEEAQRQQGHSSSGSAVASTASCGVGGVSDGVSVSVSVSVTDSASSPPLSLKRPRS